MCTPKTPEVQKTPVRAATKLPDGGDPTRAAYNRSKKRVGPSALIFANKNGTLGAPSVSAPLGA